MIQRIKYRLTGAPTPMAGLALAIASLGWCWDGVLVSQDILHTPGLVQWISAAIAAVITSCFSCEVFDSRPLIT